MPVPGVQKQDVTSGMYIKPLGSTRVLMGKKNVLLLEYWIQSNNEYSIRIITTETAFVNTHVAHASVHLRSKQPLVSDSAYYSSCMGAISSWVLPLESVIFVNALDRLEAEHCVFITFTLFGFKFYSFVGIVQMWMSTNYSWCKRWNSTILSTYKGREGYASQSTLKDWLPRS